jgi:hypothetical protein
MAVAFFYLCSMPAFLQCLEDLTDVLLVFFLILEEDQNVVKIGNADMVNVLSQAVVDKMLERGWCIA